MKYKKYGFYVATLSVVLSTVLVPFALEGAKINAQPLYISLEFPPTPRGRPRTSIGGGTRVFEPPTPGESSPAPLRGRMQRVKPTQESCFNQDAKITVLSPYSNVITTVSAQPTLFWYIPQTKVKTADFVVKDEQDQIVYQTKLALHDTPGVVKLTLPNTVVLEMGKEYQWQLVLNCGLGKTETVTGGFQRTVLTWAQKNQLAAAKQPLKKAEVYAQAGIWQETISIVAQLRQNRPSDRTANTAWQELLESVGLKDIANEPLIECCQADQ